MQDLRTAAWPVPYSGTLRPDSLDVDHGLGEPANRTVFLHRCPAAVDPLSSKISECVGAGGRWMESLTDCHRIATKRKSLVRDGSTQHQLPCLALSVDGTLVKLVRSARDRHLHRCRPGDADPCPANGLAVFRRPPPVASDPSLSADRHVPALVVSLVLTRLEYGNSVTVTVIYLLSTIITRKLCYRKDDRAMRAI